MFFQNIALIASLICLLAALKMFRKERQLIKLMNEKQKEEIRNLQMIAKVMGNH